MKARGGFLFLFFLTVAAMAQPLRVVVSVPPQQWLVEQLGGDRVEVESLAGVNDSCHGYEPPPSRLQALARVDVYFFQALPFEAPLLQHLEDRAPQVRRVALEPEVEMPEVHDHDHDHDHHHGDEHDHAHHGHEDLHTWLDPERFLAQAERIAAALSAVDPAGAAFYQERLAQVRGDLARLQQEAADRLAPVQGGLLLVYHPAFAYFAEAFGLEQLAVEADGREPSARHLAELLETARAHRVRTVFVQPQESRAAADLLARQLGATVVELDPMAYDYPANLLRLAERVAAGLAVPVHD